MTSSTGRDTLPRRLAQVWVTYLKGQFVQALAMGAMTWVVSAGIGLRWPLAMGLVAGLFESLPSIGPIIAAVPAVGVALWFGSTVIAVPNWAFALIVAGVYVLVQQIGSVLVQPRIMGERLHLPGAVVFVSVLAGAALLGPIGALIAVPVVASAREVYQYLRGIDSGHA